MSFWTDIRDAFQSAAVLAGNVFLPGSSLLTSKLVSKGSQEQLGSDLGRLAQLGSGGYGASTGNLANYGNLFGEGAAMSGLDAGMGAYPDAGMGTGAEWMEPGWGGEGMSQLDPGVQQQALTNAGWGPEGMGTGASTGGNWVTQAYNSLLGPGTQLGGAKGALGGMGSQGTGWLGPLMSVGSGISGMMNSEEQRRMAQRSIAGSAPWTSGGGQAMAGQQLQNVISGDFSSDPGFALAQQAAARASSQQPGGFAASAAATAALRYQNERMGALSGPAGVGFNPAAGYQTALGGLTSANQLASSSLGSIGYGLTGQTPSNPQMPPWLQNYLIQNGMGQQPARK